MFRTLLRQNSSAEPTWNQAGGVGAVVFYHNELSVSYSPPFFTRLMNHFPRDFICVPLNMLRICLDSIQCVLFLCLDSIQCYTMQISSAYHIACCPTVHLEANGLTFDFQSSEDFLFIRLFGDCIDTFFFWIGSRAIRVKRLITVLIPVVKTADVSYKNPES